MFLLLLLLLSFIFCCCFLSSFASSHACCMRCYDGFHCMCRSFTSFLFRSFSIVCVVSCILYNWAHHKNPFLLYFQDKYSMRLWNRRDKNIKERRFIFFFLSYSSSFFFSFVSSFVEWEKSESRNKNIVCMIWIIYKGVFHWKARLLR